MRWAFLAACLAVLHACVGYETDCGVGEFTYEPYPAVMPAGAVQTPIFPIRDDAHCLRPGSSIVIENLDIAYPDLAQIQRMEFAVLHTRWDPKAVGAGGQGVWSRLADPTLFEITDFTLDPDGLVTARIPSDIIGEPPAAATIRMTYADADGAIHVVDIEADRRENVYDHALFFVPVYRVYLARFETPIGFNFLDRTVQGTAFSTFGQVFSGGWEEYCRIRHKNFMVDGFNCTPEFTTPNAWTVNPNQGYEVNVPATQTGSLIILYQVVCPADVWPSGQNWFSNWGLLGNYTLGSGESYIRGMPPIGSVSSP